VGLLLLIGTWFAGPGRRAVASRRNLAPYLRDPAIAYGTYAAIVLVLLAWAPVPAASDPVIAPVLIILGAIGIEALRRIVKREFPDATERDLGQRIHSGLRSAYHGVRHGTPSEPAAEARYSSLEKLASLHDRGAISDDEFATEKAELLAHR
jgi:hypothetical protein